MRTSIEQPQPSRVVARRSPEEPFDNSLGDATARPIVVHARGMRDAVGVHALTGADVALASPAAERRLEEERR